MAVTSVAKGATAGQVDLLITTFSPVVAHDGVYRLNDIGAVKAGTANATLSTLDDDATWPNQADAVPAGAIKGVGEGEGVVTAGGFFVAVPGHPSKATGSVNLIIEGEKREISTDKDKNFYHHVEWLDVNGDGLLDLVGARAYVPQYVGKSDSELVWLEQPSNTEDLWTSRSLITDGPDVSFVTIDAGGDGRSQFVATEFFVHQRLALYSCSGATWALCGDGHEEPVMTLVIDDTEGAMFNVQWVDLDGDGAKDLLVTSQGKKGSGKVLAYVQPEDWETGGAWAKHVLADGYSPLSKWKPGQGSPGTAVAFDAGFGGAKPWIVVSADDGGYVDLLVPATDAQGDFAYAKKTVVQSTGTVGTVSVGDADGDGVPEIFVPLFAEGRLAMYALSASD